MENAQKQRYCASGPLWRVLLEESIAALCFSCHSALPCRCFLSTFSSYHTTCHHTSSSWHQRVNKAHSFDKNLFELKNARYLNLFKTLRECTWVHICRETKAALAHMKEANTCIKRRAGGGLENFPHIDIISVWLRNRMWFPTTFGSSDNCGWGQTRNTPLGSQGLPKSELEDDEARWSAVLFHQINEECVLDKIVPPETDKVPSLFSLIVVLLQSARQEGLQRTSPPKCQRRWDYFTHPPLQPLGYVL